MAVEVPTIPVSGGVCAAQGFMATGVRAGIKQSGKPDLALLVCTEEAGSVCAGVFTTNLVHAPCVLRNRAVLQTSAQIQAVVINAGNANAGNGAQGERDNEAFANAVQKATNEKTSAVLTASTGVIGTRFPIEKATAGIGEAYSTLEASAEGAARAAQAIMTTDLVPKEYAVEVSASGTTFRVGGMAKGSGMIAPNMATMLAFVTTDLAVSPEIVNAVLRRAVDKSFNCLTVDGDTSTNDMCLLLASGVVGNAALTSESGPLFTAFLSAVTEVCTYLAKAVARDGEGATKLVTVHVSGAETDTDARRVAKTIAESPLVKTALFGNDPNWGRILAAAGRAGVQFDPNQATADLAGTRIFAHGTPAPFDAKSVSEAMRAREVEITLSLGPGKGTATVYTCDLSYDYIRINAEYHT